MPSGFREAFQTKTKDERRRESTDALQGANVRQVHPPCCVVTYRLDSDYWPRLALFSLRFFPLRTYLPRSLDLSRWYLGVAEEFLLCTHRAGVRI